MPTRSASHRAQRPRTLAEARADVLDSPDLLSIILHHAVHQHSNRDAILAALRLDEIRNRVWTSSLRSVVRRIPVDGPQWQRFLQRLWKLAYTMWRDYADDESPRHVFAQHMAARAACESLQAQRYSGPLTDADLVTRDDMRALGRPAHAPQFDDYSLGIEVRHLARGERRDLSRVLTPEDRVWLKLTRPTVLATWEDCVDLPTGDVYGTQEDGLFWICQTDLSTGEHSGAAGCDLLNRIREDGDGWEQLICSMCLRRHSDGKVAQLVVDQPTFEEQLDEECFDFYASFSLGPAIARFEITLDVSDLEDQEIASLNVAIDPREPNEYIYLIRTFKGLLRLLESEAARDLWK